MITVKDYFMGRDVKYADELTQGLRMNAAIVVERANLLVARMHHGMKLNHITKTIISSGWRPLSINTATPNAAKRSKHMTCCAIDIYDPDAQVDKWCMSNLPVLEKVGLWMEHPSATPGWSHWQIIPPKSRNRVFYP